MSHREQMVDFLSLLGDSVDNIPGAPGVGEKTAAQLLQNYGTLDNLLAHVADIAKPKLRDSLVASAERLQTNRQLIRLQADLPLSLGLESLKVQSPDATALAAIYRRCGFKSLLARFENSPRAGDRICLPENEAAIRCLNRTAAPARIPKESLAAQLRNDVDQRQKHRDDDRPHDHRQKDNHHRFQQ